MSTVTSRAGALCGVLVGACSGLFAMAAHAVAGGQVPTGPTLVLVALVCATVGALAGAADQPRAVGLVAAVGAGQLLTHVVLAVTAGHHGGGHEVVPSAPMMLAHALAAVALGLLICLVGHLYRVCATVLCWLMLTLVHRGRPSAPRRHRTTSAVVQMLLLRSGLGMRAPPAAVSIGG
ncbi:hypothetical protein [Mycolicibacterium baixiangningiae]|uniref:hypothetical protein n=1 Tax=Mycolicibacterium baixiangningiae TaxID=2761578 RepID=UPI0027DA6C71|nr:hypothetical protein [Mycolicibacterium baixiangningiae]